MDMFSSIVCCFYCLVFLFCSSKLGVSIGLFHGVNTVLALKKALEGFDMFLKARASVEMLAKSLIAISNKFSVRVEGQKFLESRSKTDKDIRFRNCP